MVKVFYALLSIFILLSCSGPDISPPPPTPTPGGGTVTPEPPNPEPPTPTPPSPSNPNEPTNPRSPNDPSGPGTPTGLASAVDDKSWVDYLHGTWGIHNSIEGYKYSSYQYGFNKNSDVLKFKRTYNDYVYILDTKISSIDYRIRIKENVLYVMAPNGEYRKEARFEKVSEDEIRLFQISETGSSTREFNLGILTKISDVEKSASEVIKSGTMKNVLTGQWKQASSSIYTDLIFDFSASKNYFHYSRQFNGGKETTKNEFKVDENGMLYYREWAGTFNPAWKRYFVEVVSESEIKLYQVVDGKKKTLPEFTMKR